MPAAAADEGAADCEDGQPWIGYSSTDAARTFAQDVLRGTAGLALCEGEQWDGQDPIEDDPAPCPGPRVDPNPTVLHASLCMDADPNDAPSGDIIDPIGLRASSSRLAEAYASTNVALVGRVAIYAGTCGASDPGLEGAASCGGSRELRTGVYIRDNTPGNVIFTLLVCRRYTICNVGEADCDQATYAAGAYDPPSRCGRDNTAFGFQLLLP